MVKGQQVAFNIDKTCYTVFTPNKILVPTVTIKVSDVKINCIKERKYLGVIIDNELKRTSYIKTVLRCTEIKKVTEYFIYDAS